jgi:hypothetical protein
MPSSDLSIVFDFNDGQISNADARPNDVCLFSELDRIYGGQKKVPAAENAG